MRNKFLIDDLTALSSLGTSALLDTDTFIVERLSTSYKIGAPDIAKNILGTHLELSVARSRKKKANNILSVNYINGNERDNLLTVQLQDGILSSAQFDSTTYQLSLWFNVVDPDDENPIVVDLSSLHDVYSAGYGLNLSTDGTFSVDTSQISDIICSASYDYATDSLKLNKTKTSEPDVTVSLSSKANTCSIVVPEVHEASAFQLHDSAVNVVTPATYSSLLPSWTFLMPACTQGKSRMFSLNLSVDEDDVTQDTITLSDIVFQPDDGGSFMTDDGAFPQVSAGCNFYTFTEVTDKTFYVKKKMIYAT